MEWSTFQERVSFGLRRRNLGPTMRKFHPFAIRDTPSDSSCPKKNHGLRIMFQRGYAVLNALWMQEMMHADLL
jgi:hypothetical protein